MPFEEPDISEAQIHQQERREEFGAQAAERIRASENCLFSLLPHEELSRLSGEWYEACSQGMLRGNYAPIDTWVRTQSHLAAGQGFSPEDILHLFQICRKSAIELENWNQDIFSNIDEVIDEVFVAIRSKISWKVQDGPNQEAAVEAEAALPSGEMEQSDGERRRFSRNRLHFPIRVVSSPNGGSEEITQTQSISRGGLYFFSTRQYRKKQALKINFPYWNVHGGINTEYPAEVIRLDHLPDHAWGVGVDFLEQQNRGKSPPKRKV